MATLNQNQAIIYQSIIAHIGTMPNGDFCLDEKTIYGKLNLTLAPSSSDKRAIGKYFKEQVVQKLIPHVRLHNIYGKCPCCAFKDSSNKIHYEKY